MKTSKSKAGFLIFLCWLLYSVSYFGKVNYAANITQIIDFYGVSKAQAGIPSTFFFFAYGVGQVFNGIFCKKYPLKYVIFGSLVTSAAINFTVAVSTDFFLIQWLWLLNGFVLAVLWPSLVRLLSENLPQEDLGRSSVIMGTTVATGTIGIYGLSAVYAHFGMFKLAFYTAAVSDLAVAFVWLFLYQKCVRLAYDSRKNDEHQAAASIQTAQKANAVGREKKLLVASVGILCLCAVGVNLIKDGLTTWVPSILKEEYAMSDSLSILLALLLPTVAIFGNLFALTVHRKIPDYVTHCALFFGFMLVLVRLIIVTLHNRQPYLMLAGLIIMCFMASSLNSLITSIFPMFMREKLNAGLFAGVLNGFCYLGSTLSSYGLGVIADNYGWTAVFFTLMGVCAAVCVVWCFYALVKRVHKKQSA